MNYQDALTAHLVRYKHTVMGVHEPGVFRYGNRDLLKEHILPRERGEENLLSPARAALTEYQRTRGPLTLHRYFHHLNSSQAFALNLFLPFFSGSATAQDALLRAVGCQTGLDSWELEAIPDEDERTNLDARWTLRDGTEVICEVKLSEAEFGRAINDDEHRSKLRNTYAPRLVGKVAPKWLEVPGFFEVYQILRNVWHMLRHESGRLVFLMPRANVPLWKELGEVLPHLDADVRGRVSLVAIEDVLSRLQSDTDCPSPLRYYARQLEAKYVPPLV